MARSNVWLSDKGIKSVLKPYCVRKHWTEINPKICQTLTRGGQQRWSGTMIALGVDRAYAAAEDMVAIQTCDKETYYYNGERFYLETKK